MSEPIHIISLGAGVQSSTMALMAAAGEITPMPKCAIFADTQVEPKSVYIWLDWLEKQLPFPVYRVTRGSLIDECMRTPTSKKTGLVYSKASIPAFLKHHDGKLGMLGRKCTTDFKVVPITRKIRTLCDWKRGEKRKLVKCWIGISRDEVYRMKPNRELWIENIWPLVDLGYTRDGCLSWMKQRGHPEPPRSACVFCPFHGDEEWKRLKSQEPEEFHRAVLFERELTKITSKTILDGIPFLHSDCVPIDRVKFKDAPSHVQLNMFNNECEGMCGV